MSPKSPASPTSLQAGSLLDINGHFHSRIGEQSPLAEEDSPVPAIQKIKILQRQKPTPRYEENDQD